MFSKKEVGPLKGAFTCVRDLEWDFVSSNPVSPSREHCDSDNSPIILLNLFVKETITLRWEWVIRRSHQGRGAAILPLLKTVYLFLGLPSPEPTRNLALSGVLQDTLL